MSVELVYISLELVNANEMIVKPLNAHLKVVFVYSSRAEIELWMFWMKRTILLDYWVFSSSADSKCFEIFFDL